MSTIIFWVKKFKIILESVSMDGHDWGKIELYWSAIEQLKF